MQKIRTLQKFYSLSFYHHFMPKVRGQPSTKSSRPTKRGKFAQEIESGSIKLQKGKDKIDPINPLDLFGPREFHESSICVICQEELAAPDSKEEAEQGQISTLKCCQTEFHQDCITGLLHATSKHECPICKSPFGTLHGDSPDGAMSWSVNPNQSLPGFPPNSGMITIMYDMPDGVQSEHHPNPGKRFTGTHRLAYLPNTSEGVHVLELLKKAFTCRLTFTVGTSLTTGASNTVIWSGIHHKTTTHGGSFGYPDPTYLSRVQDELRSKGVVIQSETRDGEDKKEEEEAKEEEEEETRPKYPKRRARRKLRN